VKCSISLFGFVTALLVVIPETNPSVLKTPYRDQKRVQVQACWATVRFFHSYNAIIDPRIDCLALVSKQIAVKAAKYQVADIIPLSGWKEGVIMFAGLRTDGQEREEVPMLIADLGVECDIVLGRRWFEDAYMQPDCNNVNPELLSSVSFSCDRRIEQESIDQKNQRNGTVPVTTFSSEAQEDLSVAYLGQELHRLLEGQNEEDASRSQIPIVDQ
jgi:hypothetical protein